MCMHMCNVHCALCTVQCALCTCNMHCALCTCTCNVHMQRAITSALYIPPPLPQVSVAAAQLSRRQSYWLGGACRMVAIRLRRHQLGDAVGAMPPPEPSPEPQPYPSPTPSPHPSPTPSPHPSPHPSPDPNQPSTSGARQTQAPSLAPPRGRAHRALASGRRRRSPSRMISTALNLRRSRISRGRSLTAGLGGPQRSASASAPWAAWEEAWAGGSLRRRPKLAASPLARAPLSRPTWPRPSRTRWLPLQAHHRRSIARPRRCSPPRRRSRKPEDPPRPLVTPSLLPSPVAPSTNAGTRSRDPARAPARQCSNGCR